MVIYIGLRLNSEKHCCKVAAQLHSFLGVSKHDTAQFPFRNKNRITDRHCFFSICLKSTDTRASTGDQNKTPSPILLLSTCQTTLVCIYVYIFTCNIYFCNEMLGGVTSFFLHIFRVSDKSLNSHKKSLMNSHLILLERYRIILYVNSICITTSNYVHMYVQVFTLI